jgi:hypothetical protein
VGIPRNVETSSHPALLAYTFRQSWITMMNALVIETGTAVWDSGRIAVRSA